MPKHILVVGSINLDLVAQATRIPQAGETVHGETFQTFFGGKGANQAVAAARLGGRVAMIDKVGSDEFGARLKQGLRKAGVRVASVEKAPGHSGVALITTDKHAHNSIVVVPGANGALLPEDLDHHRAMIESSAILLAQLEIPLATVEHLAVLAGRYQVPLMLDPAPARAVGRKTMRAVTWLTPNETESTTLLRETEMGDDIESTANRLLSMGCRNVILKLGSRGVYLSGHDSQARFIKGFQVKAHDTTAAGDAFNGAFAVVLTQGKSPAECARFACAAAALSVTRVGAQPSLPTREETEEFLRRAGRR